MPPADQNEILELEAWEAGLHSCGTHETDWIDDAGMPLDDPPWEVVARQCAGCAAIEARQDEIRNADVPQSMKRGGWVGLRRKG